MHYIRYNFKCLTQTLSLSSNTLSQSLKHSLKVQKSPSPKSVSNTLSVSQTLSQSSNTLSKFKHSQSNTEINHPQPLGVQQKSPSPSNALLFPHNQTIPSPIPWKSLLSLPMKVQIFSSLKVCFSYKNLSFLNNYSIWV